LQDIPKENWLECVDKIYSSIEDNKDTIINFIQKLETDLAIQIDYTQWLKQKETTVNKILRDAPLLDGGEVECFEKIKDVIRCRMSV